MKINVSEIATTLLESSVPAEAHAKYLQVAIGRVIGYLLPIPAEAVSSATDYYNEHLCDRVCSALDAVVERIPVDYDATVALVKEIWTVRYGLVHPQTDAQAWALLDACATKQRICPEIDFSDVILQRLASVLMVDMDKA